MANTPINRPAFAVLALFACVPFGAADEIARPAVGHAHAHVPYDGQRLNKADRSLAQALVEYRAHRRRGATTRFQPSNRLLQYVAEEIVIDARASKDSAALLADLTSLGLKNGTRYANIVSGRLPIAALEQAVALNSLRSISASPAPIRHVGAVTSQGDIGLRADIARSLENVDGTGIRVGVISDSYDTLGGAAMDIATGDLPLAGVQVLGGGESSLCGTVIFCIDEGRAMLQIIRDIAPGAELLFHTGLDGKAAYANAIDTLAAAGADIIVDDLLIISEPMFQDGIIAQAIDAAAGNGVVYYSAAGNSARNSYESAFVDSGVVFCIEFIPPANICDPTFERVGRIHDFDPGPGQDFYQHITIPVDGRVTIVLQWDQPFGGPGPVTDHDLVLLNQAGDTVFAIGANDNVTLGEGWEAVQYVNADVLDNGSEFSLMLTYDDVDSAGPPATLVKTVIFGAGVTINEFATGSSTTYGHANAANAAAVGAAFFLNTPEFGTSPPALEPFSSAGGTPILFAPDGSALGAPVIRPKPQFVAIDGVNTTFFFDDSFGNDGIDDFFGTSAAAPHAAGVAALLLEASPGATPTQVNEALASTAIDMGAPGFDFDSGAGLIQTDAAIAALNSGAIDSDGDGVVDSADNCTLASNAAQNDTDGDGFGNHCDPDFNNDCAVNFADLGVMQSEFFGNDPDADLNGDGVVNFADLAVVQSLFFGSPGPSGVPNLCNP